MVMAGDANGLITESAMAVLLGAALFLTGIFVVELPGEERFGMVLVGIVLCWAGLKSSH